MFKKFGQWVRLNRLRLKLLGAVVGVVLLFLSVSTFFSVKQTGEIILEQLDVYGNSMARSLANFCIEDLIAWDYPSIQLALNHIGKYDGQLLKLEIYHQDKLVAGYVSDEYTGEAADVRQGVASESAVPCECLTFEEKVKYDVLATGETMDLGKVKIVLSKKKYEAFLDQQLLLLFYLSIILLIGDSIFSYLTVKWLILNPINKVGEGAEIIGKGDLNHRVNVKRDDEIGKVALAINEMAGNLLASKNEAEDYKRHLEEKVKARTKELRELTENLEDKVEERTKQLSNERNKTRATLFSLPAGLIVFDKNEKITLVNPAAEEILRIKENDVLNKKITELKKFRQLEKLYDILGRKIEWTDEKFELEIREPILRYFQVALTNLVIENEITGVTIILNDITRDKEIERMKNEFISISAHQLRTPSSAIKWTLSMLLNGEMGRISKEAKEYLKRAKETNDRMIDLINDLLNISRIEEGRFLYDKKPVSISDFVKEIVSSAKIVASEKSVNLKMELLPDNLPQVHMDKEKMTIALQNIIDNAIRYSAKGGKVAVNLKQVEEKNKPFIQIEVRDKGIGIPAKDLGRLFSKFYRAENAVRTQTEGSGLGLFITKNIINAHGGTIRVESKLNEGTIFYLLLPLKNVKIKSVKKNLDSSIADRPRPKKI